jgi:hypothetical protein
VAHSIEVNFLKDLVYCPGRGTMRAAVYERKFDIAFDGEEWQQMKTLKDESDAPIA